MVKFSILDDDENREIEPLDDKEFRLLIPMPRYFILAKFNRVLVRSGNKKQVKYRIVSGKVTLYSKDLETLIETLQESDNPLELDLISSATYTSFGSTN